MPFPNMTLRPVPYSGDNSYLNIGPQICTFCSVNGTHVWVVHI